MRAPHGGAGGKGRRQGSRPQHGEAAKRRREEEAGRQAGSRSRARAGPEGPPSSGREVPSAPSRSGAGGPRPRAAANRRRRPAPGHRLPPLAGRGRASRHGRAGTRLRGGGGAVLSRPVPSHPVLRAGGRAAGSSARCQRKAAVLLRNGKYRQGCCIGSRSAASYGRGSVNHAVYKDESRLKNPGFDKSALISLQSYYRVISKRRSRDPVCSCHECNCQVKQGRLPGRKTLSRVFRCW